MQKTPHIYSPSRCVINRKASDSPGERIWAVIAREAVREVKEVGKKATNLGRQERGCRIVSHQKGESRTAHRSMMGRLQSALYVGVLCLASPASVSAYDDRWATAQTHDHGVVD